MKGHLSNSHTNSFTFGQRHFRIFPQLIFSYMWRLDSTQPCVYTPAIEFLVPGLLYLVLSHIFLCHSSPGGMLQQIDLFGFARTLQAHSAGKRRKLREDKCSNPVFLVGGNVFFSDSCLSRNRFYKHKLQNWQLKGKFHLYGFNNPWTQPELR